ncbi:MAG TPA: LptA/OstA family protein [Bryobacteraceae bacterium]|nr:LptA/OstA family protein [Bryobacteraceae bacterium]
MFRRTRLLLLMALAAIVGAVGIAFYVQRASLARHAPSRPSLLPTDTNAAAQSWVYTKAEGGLTKVEVRAKNFRQVANVVELDGVELKLFSRDGKDFDYVKSAKARFDQAQGTLYSEGDVEITMGVPADKARAGRLVSIRSSGVTFEAATGKVQTDRAASFGFENGNGKCVGAAYDPSVRELIMKSAVELNWSGRGPDSAPMKIEAGELFYKELNSAVDLRGWSRLTRGSTVLDAADSYVTLKDGTIERVEALKARGAERAPGRTLDYQADKLLLEFTPKGEMRKATGNANARVLAVTDSARTEVTGDRVDLEFEALDRESTLKQALATGKAVLESAPVPRKGRGLAETRRLSSEVVLMKMRTGGREVERMETHAPGRLEFLPNQPGQRRRTLDAERMQLEYAADNTPKLFTASKASTRTEPKKKDEPPMLTRSDDFKAEFDDRGELARIEQWNNFRYEEGGRRGRSDRATLDQAKALITLDRNARFQDAAGSVAADRIDVAQNTGDLVAEGNVVSTRMPEQKAKSSSAMLSSEEPMEGRARRMTTADRNRRIRYEGSAVVWQGSNRLSGEAIDINRAERKLSARGKVRTQFADERSPTAGGPQGKAAVPARAPAFVVVEASALDYNEADRIAHYTGGARLMRPGMDVRAAEIRAFLNDSSADSTLDRAIADGGVRILRTDGGRTLNGTSEHAEYYAAEQKIVLTGGQPVLDDSSRGVTRGRELTYLAKDDKLLVNGAERAPVISDIRRSRK